MATNKPVQPSKRAAAPAVKSAVPTVDSTGKKKRYEFRLDDSQHLLLEKAAMYRGLSVADLIRSTMLEKAQEIVESHERLVLNDKQRDWFLALLENPPKPNAAMKRAMESHRRLIRTSR